LKSAKPTPAAVEEAKPAPKKAARKPAASKMTKEKLKEKMAKSKQVDELDEIKELKKKLDALLAKTGTVA
jgi:peroxiredoxin family protein